MEGQKLYDLDYFTLKTQPGEGLTAYRGILRARGGSSHIARDSNEAQLYSPRTRR